MPISVAGNNRHRAKADEAGFTIIELMIVVTLIALAAATVALAFPGDAARLRDDAARFAARTRAARDMAIIEGRSVSVWVSPGGYGFDRRAAQGWEPIADKPLRVARWSDGIRSDVTSPDGRARVTFDSTGFVSAPLTVDLHHGDRHQLVRIGSDGVVRLDG